MHTCMHMYVLGTKLSVHVISLVRLDLHVESPRVSQQNQFDISILYVVFLILNIYMQHMHTAVYVFEY